MVQTLVSLQLFPQPMDRAEVLHAPSHTYKDRWKIVPIENDQVESQAISAFQKISPTLFTAGDLSVLPGAP